VVETLLSQRLTPDATFFPQKIRKQITPILYYSADDFQGAAPLGDNIYVSITPEPLRIVTVFPFEPDEIARIQMAAGAPIEIQICRDLDEFRRRLPEADVVYGDLRAAELPLARRLRWLQSGAAGLDTMDRAVLESPVPLTNYAATFAPAIAETAMGMLLSLTRGIAMYYVPQFLKHTMNPVGTMKSAHHTELAGRTMGIAGMGGIGRALARKAHYGFEMRVVATDAGSAPKPDYVAELHDPSWLLEMVAHSDVVVAAAPLTPSTERMFNEAVFRRMQKTAIFMALSRGGLFDDLALVRALKEGWIAGACLDVFPQEPPPSDHPIFDCPNVVMTAHTAGWGPDRQDRLVALFAENVRRFVAGEPLLNLVDKAKGY
jgi:phosphoglycerate dehydrogenase-like enzyme